LTAEPDRRTEIHDDEVVDYATLRSRNEELKKLHDAEEAEFEEEDNDAPSDSINACALVGIACSLLVVMYV